MCLETVRQGLTLCHFEPQKANFPTLALFALFAKPVSTQFCALQHNWWFEFWHSHRHLLCYCLFSCHFSFEKKLAFFSPPTTMFDYVFMSICCYVTELIDTIDRHRSRINFLNKSHYKVIQNLSISFSQKIKNKATYN